MTFIAGETEIIYDYRSKLDDVVTKTKSKRYKNILNIPTVQNKIIMEKQVIICQRMLLKFIKKAASNYLQIGFHEIRIRIVARKEAIMVGEKKIFVVFSLQHSNRMD